MAGRVPAPCGCDCGSGAVWAMQSQPAHLLAQERSTSAFLETFRPSPTPMACRETSGLVEPLQAELNDLDQQLRDKQELIGALKVKAFDNDTKIQVGLGGG